MPDMEWAELMQMLPKHPPKGTTLQTRQGESKPFDQISLGEMPQEHAIEFRNRFGDAIAAISADRALDRRMRGESESIFQKGNLMQKSISTRISLLKAEYDDESPEDVRYRRGRQRQQGQAKDYTRQMGYEQREERWKAAGTTSPEELRYQLGQQRQQGQVKDFSRRMGQEQRASRWKMAGDADVNEQPMPLAQQSELPKQGPQRRTLRHPMAKASLGQEALMRFMSSIDDFAEELYELGFNVEDTRDPVSEALAELANVAHQMDTLLKASPVTKDAMTLGDFGGAGQAPLTVNHAIKTRIANLRTNAGEHSR